MASIGYVFRKFGKVYIRFVCIQMNRDDIILSNANLDQGWALTR